MHPPAQLGGDPGVRWSCAPRSLCPGEVNEGEQHRRRVPKRSPGEGLRSKWELFSSPSPLCCFWPPARWGLGHTAAGLTALAASESEARWRVVGGVGWWREPQG